MREIYELDLLKKHTRKNIQQSSYIRESTLKLNNIILNNLNKLIWYDN